MMALQERLRLISEVGEEIVTPEELKALLQEKKHPIAYDGFEPSGRVHIAQGLLRAININKMIAAGCRFKMLVADWHGWANNKMGGDLDKIQTVGKYLIEVWKASGMNLDNVDFVWASELVKEDDYWKKVMQVARNTTVARIVRCGQIMGRNEDEVLQTSQILYPCMQAADIFQLKADICQLGLDQRKVNILAREIGPKLGFWKPVVVSHHMLMGLLRTSSTENDKLERTIDLKMSKSRPDSAIFMTDSKAEIERKIKNAYCPERQTPDNPVIEYCKYIILEKFKPFEIERKNKSSISVQDYDDLKAMYSAGEIHPLDLKMAVAAGLNDLLEPVRRHFENNAKANELLQTVNKLEVTR